MQCWTNVEDVEPNIPPALIILLVLNGIFLWKKSFIIK